MKHKEYVCNKLCFPLNAQDITSTLKNEPKPKSLLFICMDMEVVSTCINKELNFVELKDLISISEFNALSVNEILNDWRGSIEKNDLDILETDYSYVFNYHISHVVRAIRLSDLISQSIGDNIDYKHIEFYKNNWPLAYSRANISFLIRQLVSISIGLNERSVHTKTLLMRTYFWSFLYSNVKSLVRIEFLLYSLNPLHICKWIKLVKSTEIKRVLFFSGGRDLRFHSLLSKFLGNYSVVALKGKSKWNDKKEPEHSFELLTELFPLLWKGYLSNRRSVNKSFQDKDFRDLLNSLTTSENRFIKDYIVLLEKFVGFKIERDIMMIRSCCGIIDKVNADLVFTSSLPLPLISAKICEKVTISEFEGFGIEMNPMAPYIGHYVSAPGPLSAEQLEIYKGGAGEILPIGAYYYS